jgi:thyrotropin receptor
LKRINVILFYTSIISFFKFLQKLERAYLTHSFHCCAFKYPSRHDPTRHREYLDLLKDFKLKCKGEKSFLSDSTSALSDRSKRSIAGHDINSYNVDEATENSQFFDDGDVEGFFHEPVQLNHTYTAATCGNLSIM